MKKQRLMNESLKEQYKVEVIADSSDKWAGNSLRFVTKEEAEGYAKKLMDRWMSSRDWRMIKV